MKKLIAILSTVAFLFVLGGCAKNTASNKGKAEEKGLLTAVWPGYDEMSFAEFLKKAAEEVPTDITGLIIEKAEVTAYEGWSDSDKLNETSVAEGKIPVTYLLEIEYIDMNCSEIEGSEELRVFAELDKATNILEIMGGGAFEEGECTATETIESLKLAKLVVNGDIKDFETYEIHR